MKRMRISRLFALIFLFLFPISTANSRSTYIPFEPYGAAWDATHILVATEGDEIDGKLFILESWKGNLNVGEEVFVPELTVFRELSSREIKSSSDKEEKSAIDLRYVSGSRMILFLSEKNISDKTNKAEPDVSTDAGIQTIQGRWKTLNDHHTMPIIWIEHENPYIFEVNRYFSKPKDNQTQNDLSPSWETETIIKKNILDLLVAQEALKQAVEISNLEKRAAALEFLTQTKFRIVNHGAIRALGYCGVAAEQILMGLMNDLAVMGNSPALFWSIRQIGSEVLDNELIKIIREDRNYFKLFPLKPTDNFSDPESETLRNRVYRHMMAFSVLKSRLKLSNDDDVKGILEFIDFHPELGNDLKQIGFEFNSFRKSLND